METSVSVPVPVPPIEAPRGRFPGRLDDKGRLKLPADFQAYFSTLEDRRFFITSLDRRVAQIYPIAAWRENEAFFRVYREDPEALSNIRFNATDLGGMAEMDAQGRITFNPELRRELGLEGTELHLDPDPSGRVEVLTDAIYQERRRMAQIKKTADDINKLRMAGLQ